MFISDERKKSLEEFQKKYGFDFKNLELLNQAFIHTSYVRENSLDISLSYEKLEFFGDAVLKLVVSEFLYNTFLDYQEGELTKLRAEIVSDRNIYRYACILGFENLIILGKNERKQGGAKKESILACAFEALLGAIFIEYNSSGYAKARDFLEENFKDDMMKIDSKIDFLNPKAILQEYTQGLNKDLPQYNIVNEVGDAHNKTFFAQVIYQNKVIGEGSAQSIKKAHQQAAYNALVRLNLIKRNNNDNN